jgi:hypothetical protein
MINSLERNTSFIEGVLNLPPPNAAVKMNLLVDLTLSMGKLLFALKLKRQSRPEKILLRELGLLRTFQREYAHARYISFMVSLLLK